MALTRKFLAAMGIEADKVDEIIEAHTQTVNALKQERDEAKEKADKYADIQKKLDAANDQLKEYEKNDGDKWEVKYNALKEEFDDYKTGIENAKTKQAKSDAFKDLLKGIGISDKRINSVLKVSDVDSIELDEAGKIKNESALKDSMKKEWADFIVTESKKGAKTQTPPGDSTGSKMTREEIFKKDDHGRYVLSTAERQKAIAESLNEG